MKKRRYLSLRINQMNSQQTIEFTNLLLDKEIPWLPHSLPCGEIVCSISPIELGEITLDPIILKYMKDIDVIGVLVDENDVVIEVEAMPEKHIRINQLLDWDWEIFITINKLGDYYLKVIPEKGEIIIVHNNGLGLITLENILEGFGRDVYNEKFQGDVKIALKFLNQYDLVSELQSEEKYYRDLIRSILTMIDKNKMLRK